MTHKDDVAALPGSAPQLAAMADPVYTTVDGGVFDDLGAMFSEAAGRTAVATNKVRSVVGGLDGAWDGASADSFVEYMNGFTAAGTSVADALTNAAAARDPAPRGGVPCRPRLPVHQRRLRHPRR